MDTASAGMTENERAFQVWLRLCRARLFVVNHVSVTFVAKILAYRALLALFVSLTWHSPIPVYAGHGEEPVQTISMEKVKFLLDNKEKVFFVDLRTPKEFQQKRLPGARSIPIAELDKRLTEIPKTGRVILYCTCRPGDDSYAYFLLRDNEYNNVSVIDDGFDGWIKRKFPVESGK
jgi:rhodanese-related sulfurtransferase